MGLLETFRGLDIPLVLILFSVAAILFYIWGTSQYVLWSSLGIPGPRPLPLIGTALGIFRKGMFVHDADLVRRYGKIVGTYEGSRPVLLVADTRLVKEVMTRNFTSFMDRQLTVFFSGKENYPIRKVMTRLTGDHWKHVRGHMTPAFSSGKLKAMTSNICRCATNLVDRISQDMDGEGRKPIHIKCYLGAYTMDVIAATAFGLDLNSQQHPNSPFVANAKKAMDLNITNLRTVFILLFPGIAKRFTSFVTSIFPTDVSEFFVDILNRTMEKRREENNGHPDFLQLMLDVRVDDVEEDSHPANDEHIVKGPNGVYDKRGLTHEEILAQSLLFFVAGYETTAATLTFMGYSLALNQECQRILQEEIDSALLGKDAIDYSLVNELPYLDMCISETLRLYPPAVRLIRVCTKDTVLGSTPVSRGTLVGMPAHAMHRNPDVWPDPDTFQPNRWTTEEKAQRDPYNYLPFGQGPRNCIGMRLALLEVKVAMVHLLRKFEFHVSNQTQIPPSFKKGFLLQTEQDIILDLVAR